jgi:hypothetical protein
MKLMQLSRLPCIIEVNKVAGLIVVKLSDNNMDTIKESIGRHMTKIRGIQEERGNMGEIGIIPESVNSVSYMTAGTTNSSYLEPVTNKSVSMIDWQYQMQKKLQKPPISKSGIEEAEHGASAEEEAEAEALRQQSLSAIDTSKGISIVPESGNPGNDAFY